MRLNSSLHYCNVQHMAIYYFIGSTLSLFVFKTFHITNICESIDQKQILFWVRLLTLFSFLLWLSIRNKRFVGGTHIVIYSSFGVTGHVECVIVLYVRHVSNILTEQGATEVDCVVVDVQKEKALNIALNKVSGEWDAPLLEYLFEDLSDSGFDVSLTRFEAADLDELLGDDNLGTEDVKEDDFNTSKALEDIKIPMSQCGRLAPRQAPIDVWG